MDVDRVKEREIPAVIWSDGIGEKTDVSEVLQPCDPQSNGPIPSNCQTMSVSSSNAVHLGFTVNGEIVDKSRSIWQWRANRAKHLAEQSHWLRRVTNSKCNEIGLDFNVGSVAKQTLDLQLLTNGVMVEVSQFAREISRSHQHVVFDILEYNFDLGLENEEQSHEYRFRVNTRVKHLMRQSTGWDKPDLSELFEIPDPSTIIYKRSEYQNDDSVICTETDMMLDADETVQVPVTDDSLVSLAEETREDLYPLCKDIGLDLVLNSKCETKQKLDLCLLTKGVMLEVAKYASDVSGTYRQIILDVLEHNFEIVLQKKVIMFELWNVVKRKKGMKGMTNEKKDRFLNQVFRIRVPKKRKQAVISSVGNALVTSPLSKKRQLDLRGKPEVDILTASSERISQTAIQSVPQHLEIPNHETDLSEQSPVSSLEQFNVVVKSDEDERETSAIAWSDGIDKKADSPQVRHSCQTHSRPTPFRPNCQTMRIPSARAADYIVNGETVDQCRSRPMWQWRANHAHRGVLVRGRSSKIPYSRCKEMGIDLNVGSAAKQKLDLQILTNGIMIDLHHFAREINGAHMYVVCDILEYNFDVGLQNKPQRYEFGARTMKRLRQLMRKKHQEHELREVFELPDPKTMAICKHAMSLGRKDTVSKYSRPADLCMQNESDQDLTSPQHVKTDSICTETDMILDADETVQVPIRDDSPMVSLTEETREDLYPLCKDIGLDMVLNSKCGTKQKLDLCSLTKGVMLEVAKYANEVCGTYKQIIFDVLEHNFGVDLLKENPELFDCIIYKLKDIVRRWRKGIGFDKIPDFLNEVFQIRLHKKRKQAVISSVKDVTSASPVNTGASHAVMYTESANNCNSKVTQTRNGMPASYQVQKSEKASDAENSQLDMCMKMIHDISMCEQVQPRQFFSKLTKCLRDWTAFETFFKQILAEYKSRILPLLLQEYSGFSHSEMTRVSLVTELFCFLHLIDGLVHQAKTTLLLWDQMILEDVNVGAINTPYKEIPKVESGVVRLVRTVSDAVLRPGCAHLDELVDFETFLTSKGAFDEVPFTPSKGNRIDSLFYNAAGVYSIHDDMAEFTSDHVDEGSLLTAVAADLKVQPFKAGCRALGLIYKLIIDPLWKVLSSKGNVLEMEVRYQTLVTKLKVWQEDGRDFVTGNVCLFDDMEIPKDLVFERLTTRSDPVFCDLTVQIVELLLASFVEVCSKMVPVEPESKTQSSCTKDLVILEHLQKTKYDAVSIALDSMVKFKSNRTWEWLLSLDKQKRLSVLKTIQQALEQQRVMAKGTRKAIEPSGVQNK